MQPKKKGGEKKINGCGGDAVAEGDIGDDYGISSGRLNRSDF